MITTILFYKKNKTESDLFIFLLDTYLDVT